MGDNYNLISVSSALCSCNPCIHRYLRVTVDISKFQFLIRVTYVKTELPSGPVDTRLDTKDPGLVRIRMRSDRTDFFMKNIQKQKSYSSLSTTQSG